jgi:hypothetical protein
MTVEIERKWFDAHEAELLLLYLEKWVVVHQESLIGAFDCFSEAYREGLRMTQSEEIFICHVTETDEVFSAPANSLGIVDAPTYFR